MLKWIRCDHHGLVKSDGKPGLGSCQSWEVVLAILELMKQAGAQHLQAGRPIGEQDILETKNWNPKNSGILKTQCLVVKQVT